MQQQRPVAALDICVQQHLAAEDIACLYTSSRDLQRLCSARLSSAVLVRSVAAAAQAAAGPTAEATAAPAPAAECHDKSIKALRWLLQQPEMTAAMINHGSQQLLAIPCVPLAAADALVRAGLRVQITAQQLVERAYKHMEGLEVWVAAFNRARVPQQDWAAELPEALNLVCCCVNWLPGRHPKVFMGLTQDEAADLLAVALNVAAGTYVGTSRSAAIMDTSLADTISLVCRQPAAAQLQAAAVEALLRLLIHLCKRFDTMKAERYALSAGLSSLAQLPGAKQLPAASLIELVELAQQVSLFRNICVLSLWLLRLLSAVDLDHVYVRRLLALLQGPAAAEAASAYSKGFPSHDSASFMVWLASQPAAAAAAKELGLAAADVPDPAARVMLFGGQDANSAGDVTTTEPEEGGGGEALAAAAGPAAEAALVGSPGAGAADATIISFGHEDVGITV